MKINNTLWNIYVCEYQYYFVLFISFIFYSFSFINKNLLMSDPTISNYQVTYNAIDNTTNGVGIPFNYTNCPVLASCTGTSLEALYQQPVPGLNGETLENVLTDPQFHNVRILNTTATLSGTHFYECGEGSEVFLTLRDRAGTTVGSGAYIENPGNSVATNTDVIQLIVGVSGNIILGSYIIAFGIPSSAACGPYDYENVLLTFTVVVQIGICNIQSINNTQCMNYCQASGIEACLDDYKAYCLVPVVSNDPTSMRIGTDQTCYDYFSTFIPAKGSDGSIDNSLTQYCTAEFSSFDSLFLAPANQRNVCACHMPQSLYDNYIQSLFSAFPGYQAYSGLNERCFFFPCASSAFRTTDTQVCMVPQCVNVIGINDNGTFTNSNVNVTQTGGDCENITGSTAPPGTFQGGGSSGGGSGSDESFWTKYRWYIIGAIVIVVILLLIIIIVAVASGSGRSKQKKGLSTEDLLLASSL